MFSAHPPGGGGCRKFPKWPKMTKIKVTQIAITFLFMKQFSKFQRYFKR